MNITVNLKQVLIAGQAEMARHEKFQQRDYQAVVRAPSQHSDSRLHEGARQPGTHHCYGRGCVPAPFE